MFRWRRLCVTTAGRVLNSDWGAHYVTCVYRNAGLCVVVVRARNRGVMRVGRCMGSGNQVRIMKITRNPTPKHRNYSNGEHKGEEEKEEKHSDSP